MSQIDIDRPSTWRFYKNGMCNNCFGGCCTMPVEVKWEDLLRLGLVQESDLQSMRKTVKKLIKEGIITSYRQSTGLYMLSQKANRDCHFLDSKTRLCTVYEKRPGVCRQFPSIGPRPGHCPCFPKAKS